MNTTTFKKRGLSAVVALLFAIVLMAPLTAYANDGKTTKDGDTIIKEISVTLPTDYAECTFTLGYENEELAPDESILISPDGSSTYTFAESSVDKSISCTVKNVKAGVWTVRATKTFPADAAVKEICKITVSVKSSNSAAKDVTGNIALSKEISGLKYYWKDEYIVVEWTDESVGNVDVTVSDSKTLQVIGDEKVKARKYECYVGDAVDEIILTVVPSTSSGISGAESTFVIQNNYNPSAEIVFDQLEYTNLPTLHAVAKFGSEYTLKFLDNDIVTGSTGILPAGDNDVELPISEGVNELLVYVVDDDGNMKSFAYSVIVDTVPPILKIEDDVTGTSTYDDHISFSGNVSDFDTLMNGTQEVEVDERGYFDVTATLREGKNEIVLTATDKAGNVAEYKAYVTMLVKETPIISPFQIVGGICILIAIGLGIFLFIKNRNNNGPKKRKKKTIKVEDDDDGEEEEEDDNEEEERADSRNDEPFLNKTMIACSAIMFAGCLFVSIFVVQFTRVESGSMEPTIMTGDYCIVNKYAYKKRSPQRGDIVCFRSDEFGKLLLKRIIGVPGDEIEFHNGYVYINGQICDESSYISDDVETNCDKTFTVPEDAYFMMGDNREASTDSRFFESPYISSTDIEGKLFFKWTWPLG